MDRKIVTITGISCSGKSFLASYANENDTPFREAVSTTTRPMRSGEIDGVHYNFVTKEQFIAMDKNNELLEKNNFSGNFYGLSMHGMNQVYAQGKIPMVVIDPNGARNLRIRCESLGIETLNVFIDCPLETSIGRWIERFNLETEKGESNAKYFAQRISQTLAFENQWAGALDYHQVLPYSTNLNELLDQLSSIETIAKQGIVYKIPKPLSLIDIDSKSLAEHIEVMLRNKSSAVDMIEKSAKFSKKNDKEVKLSW